MSNFITTTWGDITHFFTHEGNTIEEIIGGAQKLDTIVTVGVGAASVAFPEISVIVPILSDISGSLSTLQSLYAAGTPEPTTLAGWFERFTGLVQSLVVSTNNVGVKDPALKAQIGTYLATLNSVATAVQAAAQ